MSTLYIAFDLFYAAAYRPRQDAKRPSSYANNDENYDHDDGYYYAVLQPFLISENGKPADLSLYDYLQHWDAARLAQLGAVTFLSSETIKNLPSALDITPVPFPVDTVIELSARWANDGKFDKTRQLGSATSPFAFSRATWPQFAALNYMPVPIHNFTHLDSKQIEQLFAWAYGLMQTLQRKKNDHEIDPNKPALTTNEQTILDNYFGQKPPAPALPGDIVAWRKILISDGKLAALMADLWKHSDLRGEPNLNPPGFRYSYEQLTTLGLAVFDSPPPSSYHQLLVNKLVQLEKDESSLVPPVPEKERSARGVLCRYFGFGERIRFPGIPDKARETDFMLVKMKVDGPNEAHQADGWFVTNGPSLLGQVLRLGPIPNSLPTCNLQLDVLNVCGQDLLASTLPVDDPRHPRHAIEQQFEFAFLEAKEYAKKGTGFCATLSKDPVGDQVSFLPRHGRPQSTELFHPESSKLLFAIPGSILDLLDSNARNAMPKGENAKSDLTVVNPQRTVIEASELADEGKYADWQQTKRYIRVKVHLDLIPLSAAPVGALAYELTLAHTPHPFEAAAIKDGLAKAATNGATLWIAQGAHEKETLVAVPLASLGVHMLTVSPPKLLLLDANGKLTNLLPKDLASGKSQEKADIDLVWLTGKDKKLDASEKFNLFTQEGQTSVPLIILREHFEHRVSRSADRIIERFSLKLQPQPAQALSATGTDTDPSRPILGHFANFNKLRVDLVSGVNVIKLNHPDALVPVHPKDMPLLADADYTYWLAHQFSEEVKLKLTESEANRYFAYRTAGTKWLIAGQTEHQYSHKVPVDSSGTLQLPLSSDIQNIASISIPNDDDPGKPHFALSFDLTEPPERIQLTLDSVYLRKVASKAAETPAMLRPLYEALFDLASAVQSADSAVAIILRLEFWNFDNTKNPPPPNHVADADEAIEFPNIERSMRFCGAAERHLTAIDLEPFTVLPTANFSDFSEKMKRQTFSPNIKILIDNSWKWIGASQENLLPLKDTTNLIRLGLDLSRPSESVIGPEYLKSDTQFVPLKLSPDALEESPEFNKLNMETLRGAARNDLRNTLLPTSPLRASFAWVHSIDVSRNEMLKRRATTSDRDPDRALKLLGEAYRFLNFPDDLTLPVPMVLRLFHVPFSFVPLKGHPAFGDPQTTFEFAEFLISVLVSIAQGIKPKDMEIETTPDLGIAFDLRAELIDLIFLPGGIADALLDLVCGVDPTIDLSDNHSRADDNFGDELFQYVKRECFEKMKGDIKSVLHKLLAADPSVFVSAKAIGLALFDPRTYCDNLFAVQIRKRIRQGSSFSQSIPEDNDRFSFSRFFGKGNLRFLVDVLDDKSYDDAYYIRENIYATDKSRLDPRLQTEIREVGDAVGRTGEDVLEQRFLLENPDEARRSVQAEVLHYNPEWVITSNGKTDRKYLLPSRRFPRTPKPVFPSEPNKTRFTPLKVDFLPPPFDLDAQFSDRLQDILPKSIQIVASGQSQLQANAAPEERKDQAPAAQAAGWHQLDSYISHYYFVVEPDEEQSFSNDVFEIVVERRDEPFLPMPPVPEPKFSETTDIQKWFVYHRRREEQAAVSTNSDAASIKKPKPMKLGQIIEEARKWLTIRTSGEPYGSELLLQRQNVSEIPPHTARFRQVGDRWQLENTQRRNAQGDLVTKGNIVFSELMDFSGPNADGSKAILHLAVLDDVWYYQRVNVRILRNGVDLNNNQRVDINPAFRMLSRTSEWIDYGRDMVIFPQDDRLLLSPVAFLRPSKIDLAEWLNSSMPQNFGPMIKDVLKTTFKVNDGRSLPFWELSQVLSEDMYTSAVVLQVMEDVHPRQHGSSPINSAHPARRDVLTKQILPRVRASECDKLTEKLNRTEVVTARPHLRVTWWNQMKVPVMEITWPVEWGK